MLQSQEREGRLLCTGVECSLDYIFPLKINGDLYCKSMFINEASIW
jgi:hypothetical protein